MTELSTTEINDLGSSFLVTLKSTKNKTDRSFVIKNPTATTGLDYVGLCRKYMELRSHVTKHSRFFVAYRNFKCSSQPVGKNTFGKFPQIIAKFLQLEDPDLYTGHCFRRTSTSLLADTGVNIDILKRHGGWKSATVVKGYVENSLNNKKNVAEKIFGRENASENATVQAISLNPSITSSHFNEENRDPQIINPIQQSYEVHSNHTDYSDYTNRLFNFAGSNNNININVHINQK